ncbi:class I glutamine amidotransferase-like protein [Rhypophila decipiens]|uniref:D-lactate dehydratase n=1 Tax=Rhypophila decipiens TaxID=261697 RepID=A0AAN7BAU6_9PEZI|nr:class I glutamine amidotransferase-like protein [Rhypophila decipiens]
MAPKILVILTSHGKLGDTGKPTGWFLPEFAHPYDEFKSAGFDVVVASPAGGNAPLDPASIEMFKEDASSVKFLNNDKSIWEKTQKLESFVGRSDEFDAVFVPGGHGPMFDLAVDPVSQKIIAEFASKGKVVSAVCHGPAAFVNIKLPNGEHLLQGKEVTGFSNAEEDIMKLSQAMPFMLEDKLNDASGGKFVKADEPWGEKVVVAGKVITGQNPASAKAVGEAIVKAVQGA